MSTSTQDSNESIDIRDLIAEVIPQSDAWLKWPNDRLGGMAPRELIGTNREGILRNLVEAIKIGMFT